VEVGCGPDQWGDEDAEVGAIEEEVLAIAAVVDLDVALTVNADEKLEALAVGVLAASGQAWDSVSEEEPARDEREVAAKLADGEIATKRIDDMAHLAELHAFDRGRVAGWRGDHGRRGLRWKTERVIDWGVPETVRKARPMYSPMMPSMRS
jgi:hypothetical protein